MRDVLVWGVDDLGAVAFPRRSAAHQSPGHRVVPIPALVGVGRRSSGVTPKGPGAATRQGYPADHSSVRIVRIEGNHVTFDALV